MYFRITQIYLKNVILIIININFIIKVRIYLSLKWIRIFNLIKYNIENSLNYKKYNL
jgi:hypothetical protein